MKSFTLPNGTEGGVEDACLRVGDTVLELEDFAELTRIGLTQIPLLVGDIRLRLIDEIRQSLVKEEPNGRRWVVLDALRNVSLNKWRRRSRHAA